MYIYICIYIYVYIYMYIYVYTSIIYKSCSSFTASVAPSCSSFESSLSSKKKTGIPDNGGMCGFHLSSARYQGCRPPHTPWKMNGWLNLQNTQKMKLKVNHLNQPPPFCGFNMLIFINFPGCRTSRCDLTLVRSPPRIPVTTRMMKHS